MSRGMAGLFLCGCHYSCCNVTRIVLGMILAMMEGRAMQKIILNRNENAKCWTALFFRVPNMPTAEELPLPFGLTANVLDVATEMRKRFPSTYVFYRNNLGTVSHVAD